MPQDIRMSPPRSISTATRGDSIEKGRMIPKEKDFVRTADCEENENQKDEDAEGMNGVPLHRDV